MSPTPNHFSLKGHNVTIDYSLSDIGGQPLLNFKVDALSGAAHKKDIHITKIANVGQVVTVALHSGPSADEGNPQFSFLLPEVTLGTGREADFATIGFKTTTVRVGNQHELYKEVALKGQASLIESIAAKA